MRSAALLTDAVITIHAGLVLAEAEAACSDGNCRGVLRYSTFNADYRGSQFDIAIPDLFINDAGCRTRRRLPPPGLT